MSYELQVTNYEIQATNYKYMICITFVTPNL